MKKKTIGIIAISVLCAFAIFAGAMFTHQYIDAKNSVEQFDELTDLIADVETEAETESSEEIESTEEPELSEEELEHNVRSHLKKIQNNSVKIASFFHAPFTAYSA